jgi:hypothetical protein
MTNNKQQMAVDFVPYELALELKQLGFDEPCFAFYDESLYFPNNENQYGTFCNQKLDASSCSAPTYSQAFRWFRDNHNIHSYIDILKRYNGKSVYEFVIVSDDIEEEENNRRWKTYEEAEFECLKELIEIANDKQ